MFENLTLPQLQQLWWIIISLIGAFFVFLTFVQGGQSLVIRGITAVRTPVVLEQGLQAL